jgi:hypothetical protein
MPCDATVGGSSSKAARHVLCPAAGGLAGLVPLHCTRVPFHRQSLGRKRPCMLLMLGRGRWSGVHAHDNNASAPVGPPGRLLACTVVRCICMGLSQGRTDTATPSIDRCLDRCLFAAAASVAAPSARYPCSSRLLAASVRPGSRAGAGQA